MKLTEESLFKYEGILFDLDDTLFDYESAEGALNTFHTDHNIELHGYKLEEFKSAFVNINRTLWDQTHSGKLTAKELKTKRFELLSEELKISWNIEEISEYYIKTVGEHGTWLPGVEEAYDSLIRKGYKIGILTNGFKIMQEGKRERLGLNPGAARCKCFVISEEHGFSKPDKQIFNLTLELLELPKEKVLMVGDSLTIDGKGAQNTGMDFCWINRNEKERLESDPFVHFDLPSVVELSMLLPNIKKEFTEENTNLIPTQKRQCRQ